MENIKIYAFSDEVSPNIDEQIKALLKNGLKGMEIRNVDGVNVSDITLEKAGEVRKKLDDNGLLVWSIGSPIGKIDINGNFDAHIVKFHHTLKVAKILGAQNVRIFSFYIPKGDEPSKYTDEVIQKLNILCEIANEYGITLCHENEKGIYGDTPQRCKVLFDNIPSLKGIFDPANFVQSGVDTKCAWEILKHSTYYMHIKDARADGLVVPAGQGVGNLQEIITAFIDEGGSNFTIEPHLRVFNGLKELERQGEETKMAFTYATSEEAFDTAVTSFKKLL